MKNYHTDGVLMVAKLKKNKKKKQANPKDVRLGALSIGRLFLLGIVILATFFGSQI